MSDAEKIYLPNKFYKREFPISRLRSLADSQITPAENPRGFLLDNEITQLLGGVVLGNTNFRTDQYDRRKFRWFWQPPIATTPELEKSRADRQRLSEPALFDNDGPYPGPIVVVKRDTNGDAIRPIERITPRSREIKPIPPVETLMTRNDKGEMVWIEASDQKFEDGEPTMEYPGKPETHVLTTDGLYTAVHGLQRKIKKRRKTKEWIEPKSLRAYARRGDISLSLYLSLNPDLSLDEAGMVAASFRQRDASFNFDERYGGDASAVPIAARAVARVLLGGSMRVHVPQLFVPEAWTEAEQPVLQTVA